jgi:hypothetical protein
LEVAVKKYIQIYWQGTNSIETIHAELRNPVADNEITQTTDFYLDTGETVIYNTVSHREIEEDGSQELTITYPESPTQDWSGTCTIHVAASLRTASADWQGDPPYIEHNAAGVTAKILSDELFQQREKEVVSRRVRLQKQLKEELLAIDGITCAITGETILRVLDAAHIIEVAANGADAIENAILLRADIHRLFDARLFRIRENEGAVEIIGQLSEYYTQLLENRHIDPNILGRIQNALAKRNALDQGG